MALLGVLAACAAPITAADAADAAGGGDDSARPPRILAFDYFEDYERIGHHYNVGATIRRDVDRVTATSGGVSDDAERRTGDSVRPRGTVYYFRDHKFVKQVRADLYADGFAIVTVRATNDAGSVRKRCTLHLERDPQFGDYAGGDCDKL